MSTESEKIRGDFKARLENAGRRLGFTVDRRKESQLALSGALNCLLYFHVSSRPRPKFFWGFSENQVRRLNKSGERWFLVLLRGSPSASYLLTPAQVQDRIDKKLLPIQQKKRPPEYKIFEGGAELEGIVLPRSLGELISALRASSPATVPTVDTVAEFGEGQAKAGGEIPGRARETLSETDFLKREAQRIETGRRGEEYVVEVESEALRKRGRKVLAGKVERVSTYDVFAGYDVLSFYPNGREKYIEVKTSLERMSTFEITANEVQVARELADAYWLYLVEGLEDNPKVRPIQNPSQKFGKEILLEASVYTARLS